MNQKAIRKKYIKRLEREKQSYISRTINVDASRLSKFKNGFAELAEKELAALNDYLENH